MSKCFVYTNDGYYAGEQEAYRRLPGNGTFSPPPPRPWPKQWPKWVDNGWVMEEDHRERSAQLHGADLAQEATDYWLPGDTWESQPRKMSKPGPLPQGALLEKPDRPESEKLEEAKGRKIDEITKGYEAAMAASLTMPAMENPSATDVAVGAALFAAEDAEGLDWISQAHAATHDSLMGLVIGAETVEEVEEIKVSYAV